MNQRRALRKTTDELFQEEQVVIKKRSTPPKRVEEWTDEGFAKLNPHSSVAPEVEELLDMTDSDEREWEAAQMAKVLPSHSNSISSYKNSLTHDNLDFFTLDELEVELGKDLARLEDLERNTVAMIQDLEVKIKRLSTIHDDDIVDVADDDFERVQFYKDFLQAINEAVSSPMPTGTNIESCGINLKQVYEFIQRWQVHYPADYDERLAQFFLD